MSIQTITARVGLLHGTGLAKEIDPLAGNDDYNYFTGYNAAVVRVAGTFANLKIVLDTAPGSTRNSTHVLQKGFVDTALVTTVNGAAVTATDTVHSVHFDVGDLITLKSTADSGCPDTSLVYLLEFTPDTPGESLYGHRHFAALGAYNRIFTSGSSNNLEQASSVCAIDGALTSYGVYVKTAPGVGKTITLNLVKNGVVQDGSGGTVNTTEVIADAAQDVAWAGMLPMSAGDVISLKVVYSAGAAFDWSFSGFSFLADTPGEYIMETSWADLTAPTLYGAGPMCNSPFFEYPSATETDRLLYTGTVPVLFGVPWVYVGLPNSFDPTTAVLRVNQGTPIGGPTIFVDTAASTTQGTGSYTAPAGASWTIRFTNVATSGGPVDSVLSFGIGVEQPAAPEPEFMDGNVSWPLTWLEFTDRNEDTKVFAEVDLCDDPDYFFGYKWPLVSAFKTISRGLSDLRGQVEHMSFGAMIGDLPDLRLSALTRYFRTILASASIKYITNRPLVERMIDDEDRRQKLTPRIVACGYVSDYTPAAGFQFSLSGSDWLAKKFVRKRKAQEAWQSLISLTDFPNCPPDNVAKAIPIIYGVVADDYLSGISGGPVQIAIKNGTPGGFYKHATGMASPEMGMDWHPTDDYTLGTDYPAVDPSIRSWGVLPGTVPTNPAVSAVAGGSLPGNWRPPEDGQTWSIMVTAIHGGVESDPTNVKSCYLTHSSGNKTLRVTWTAASGGADGGYNIYFAPNTYAVDASFSTYAPPVPFFVGSSLCRMVHVASGVTTVDITSDSQGVPYPFEAAYLYTVVAINPDSSESPQSELVLSLVHPYVRPVHIRWYPYSGATGYRIKRAVYPGPNVTPNFNTIIEVGATGATGPQTIEGVTQYELFDDFTTAPAGTISVTTGTPSVKVALGQIQPIYVGKLDIGMGIGAKETFLLSGRPCKNVRSNYLGGTLVDASHYGVDVWSPGQTGWTLGTDYVVINGKWMTVVQLDGLPAQGAIDGSAKLTCNVLGAEDVGDTSGNCILHGTGILLDFMQNYIANDDPWESGALLTTPDFPAIAGLGIIDEASFEICRVALAARLGGAINYEGGGVIGAGGQILSALDVIGQICLSFDFDAGFNRKGQFMISAEPITPITGTNVSDVFSIVDRTFSIEDRVKSEFFNVLPYKTTKDYAGWAKSGWAQEGDVSDALSISLYDQERESPSWDLEFLRLDTLHGQTTIADVMARKKARFRDPRRWVTFTLPFSGLSYEIGDVIPVTHIEGIGADPGWVGNNIRVMRHEVDPSNGVVRITGIDLSPIFRGAFILGDRDTMAATWTTASEFDKQYGYLADRATSLFSDGDPGKRL